MSMNCSPTDSSSRPTTESSGSSSSQLLLDSLEITSPESSGARSDGARNTAGNCSSTGGGLSIASPSSPEQLQIALGREFKTCYGCRRKLPVECFSLHRPNNAPESYRNKRCNSCRASRQAGSELTKRKKELVDSSKSRPCADCGRTFPLVAMDFDHVRGEKKLVIGSAWRWASIEALQEEIAKCDVVCACCHRIRHVDAPHKGGKRGRPPKFLADGQRVVSCGRTRSTSWGRVIRTD